MTPGFFRRLTLLFIPCEGNSYRPRILHRQALLVVLGAALAVEGFMAAQLLATLSLREFVAAVLPASIEAFTNDERYALTLPALKENPVLAEAAERKALDMARKEYFSHESPDGRQPWDFMEEAGYDYRYAGENLAVHFFDSADVVSAWMDSPSHRANIVKPVYEEIGIGIATGTYQGKATTFVVQFFGTPAHAEAATAPPPQSSTPPPTLAQEISPSPADQAPQIAGETVVADPSNAAARLLGAPRTTAFFILSGFLALLIVGILLTFVIKLSIQPLDLLANGALVAAFVAGLVFLNAHFFTSALSIGEQAAATIHAIESATSF